PVFPSEASPPWTRNVSAKSLARAAPASPARSAASPRTARSRPRPDARAAKPPTARETRPVRTRRRRSADPPQSISQPSDGVGNLAVFLWLTAGRRSAGQKGQGHARDVADLEGLDAPAGGFGQCAHAGLVELARVLGVDRLALRQTEDQLAQPHR